MCEEVGVELCWTLITKMMSLVCEVVAGFLRRVVFIVCWQKSQTLLLVVAVRC